jgi:hypothetical protein
MFKDYTYIESIYMQSPDDSVYIYDIIDSDFVERITCAGIGWDSWFDGFVGVYERRGLNVAANAMMAIKKLNWAPAIQSALIANSLPGTRVQKYRADIERLMILM